MFDLVNVLAEGDFGPVPMTIAGILMSGLVVCAGVIKALYTTSQKRFERVECKLDECEKDRLKLWEQQSINYSTIMETLTKLSVDRK